MKRLAISLILASLTGCAPALNSKQNYPSDMQTFQKYVLEFDEKAAKNISQLQSKVENHQSRISALENVLKAPTSAHATRPIAKAHSGQVTGVVTMTPAMNSVTDKPDAITVGPATTQSIKAPDEPYWSFEKARDADPKFAETFDQYGVRITQNEKKLEAHAKRIKNNTEEINKLKEEHKIFNQRVENLEKNQ